MPSSPKTWKTIIRSEILPALPGFVSTNRLLYRRLKPKDWVLAGFHLDPSAFSKGVTFVSWLVLPLFVPVDFVSLQFGQRLSGGGRWEVSEAAELLPAMLEEGLPSLNRFDNLPALSESLGEYLGRSDDPHTLEALAYTKVLLGDYRAALGVIDLQLIPGLNSDVAWERDLAARANTIRASIVDGRPGNAVEQLSAWRTYTIENLRLQVLTT